MQVVNSPRSFESRVADCHNNGDKEGLDILARKVEKSRIGGEKFILSIAIAFAAMAIAAISIGSIKSMSGVPRLVIMCGGALPISILSVALILPSAALRLPSGRLRERLISWFGGVDIVWLDSAKRDIEERRALEMEKTAEWGA